MSENKQKLIIEIPQIERHLLSSVWRKMRSGEQLRGEEIYIGRSMADHPDWFPIFETMDVLKGDDTLPDGSNPFIHLSFHTLLGSQVFNGRPLAAQRFYQQRHRRGDSAHAIIHMMIAIFHHEIAAMSKRPSTPEKPQFDWTSYSKHLRGMERLKTKDIWQRLGYASTPDLAQFHHAQGVE